ncbi:MAG: hypothetical protein CVU38_12700 [Chloroflexi bacterium HGW-Chloroflexi-1]|nr:MAG: hypothetical protein CVU38_12700 [Chloroflexi bacterium HGW-Chloroflexi-1]
MHVTLAPDSLRPRSFRWQGRSFRVLGVESVNTFGAERRFRVRTSEGRFELGLCTEEGSWRVRRRPTWLGRIWARWQNAPRYPLPAWRRRSRRVAAQVKQVAPAPLVTGGVHADRFAVVRQ